MTEHRQPATVAALQPSAAGLPATRSGIKAESIFTNTSAAVPGPIYGPWTWKKVGGHTCVGTWAVVQELGTVVTNGADPSSYGILKVITKIIKFTVVGASVIDWVNHVLALTDFSKVRWRYRITAAWVEHIKGCDIGGKWTTSKRWVSSRHSWDSSFGPNGWMVIAGSHEASDDVLESAYDVAKEISEYIKGK
jgi:hypothetical protein